MIVVKQRHVLVTGAHGFIGKNLICRLNESLDNVVMSFGRSNTQAELIEFVKNADIIVHLAGENRPLDVDKFLLVNVGLTKILCEAIIDSGRNIPIIFSSSVQVDKNNFYGGSKLAAEELLKELHHQTASPVSIYRLPGVFGKWCKPNYNSVVATFCHNISRDLPITVDNDDLSLSLVYIDDVVEAFLKNIESFKIGFEYRDIQPLYEITLGELAGQINNFKQCRKNLMIERVGSGFLRALYSTYLSYLGPDKFSYELTSHADERGVFVEMLKTPDTGQFSFLTVQPGVTRGSHYHHTKTEKFLVVSGEVKMKFRHLISGETHQILLSKDKYQVVDTIPGWAHDITNIGQDVAVVILWANEVYDPQNEDCIACKV